MWVDIVMEQEEENDGQCRMLVMTVRPGGNVVAVVVKWTGGRGH
jgi:hypothetical protein